MPLPRFIFAWLRKRNWRDSFSMENRKYGLKLAAPKPEDWKFGSSPLEMKVIQPGGQWDEFLPVEEKQAPNGFETSGCVSFGSTSVLEILASKLYKESKNFSDRWLIKQSGTDPRSGATVEQVLETLRKLGVPLQERWDFGPDITSVEQFFETPPPKLFDYAREDFSDPYDFKYDSVPANQVAIKSALECSPLGVSVSAWHLGEDGIHRSKGMPNNHWCVLYGYDDEKQAWKIFDSYDGFKKLYSYDSEMQIVKRYWIKKKSPSVKKRFSLLKFLSGLLI